jgi:uncharacterized coiled-coil protein SlyX
MNSNLMRIHQRLDELEATAKDQAKQIEEANRRA